MRTRICDLFGIEHPLLLGGMGGATAVDLVAAVSAAGGLGTVGCAGRTPAWIADTAAAIRSRTERPFGLNILLFEAGPDLVDAVIAARPAVFSTAWGWPEHDLRPLFTRARAAGSKVVHMVSTVAEARRAAEAGADAIVAQGTEGGGHVGLMATMPLVPLVVRAVAPVPVIAAGGIATGAGLVAALALGADGVLLGTRFLATPEAPIAEGIKRAIVASDGHDTVLTEIPDVARGRVWPGAYSRVFRNRFIQEWTGREGDLRANRSEAAAAMKRAADAGDAEGAAIFVGQDAGLVDSIEPAAEVVRRVMAEAEDALRRLAATGRGPGSAGG